jgi:hypothetical protein
VKDFSRRRLLKIGASLFAFVPAIGYLMSPPKAFAFEPCDDPEFIECIYYETECANYDCELQNHWYTVEECFDTRDDEICYYTFTNTGETC